MATTSASTEPSRLSFAKVAASASSDKQQSKTSFSKPAVTMLSRDVRGDIEGVKEVAGSATDVHLASETYPRSSASPGILPKAQPNSENSQTGRSTTADDSSVDAKLLDAVKALDVNSAMPSLVVNGSGTAAAQRRPYLADAFLEDMYQRVDSGSELGTKPPSLDGKSFTSGTTFALDEKESLRPDDSASVKAAEDDDAFSGRGSVVAGSRMGSEAAARAYREYNTLERRIAQPVMERQTQDGSTPHSGSSEPRTLDEEKSELPGTSTNPDGFNLFYRQTPDEKLLEALESPKDRIFLLRLEQDVIEFVKDSKEPFIDLPPSNSFCRMLTHKLADYYHMTHQVDAGAVLGAVRIFRTPFCRLPPPLTSLSNPPTSGNTPPPTMPTMKIMRRGGGGDTGPSPSKAASEAGSDTKDKSLSAKEKLSREEREAAYNRARERIFGKEEKSGDATPDDGNEMSRSSSVSTKDRAGQSKRSKPKQRRDDSDSFDVRSQYTPIFQQPQVQAPTWTPTTQYALPQQMYNPGGQGVYPNQMSNPYVPTQQYPSMMHNGGVQTYAPMVPQQYLPQQHFSPQAGSHPAINGPYGPQGRPGSIPQTQWQQQPAVYQTPYQPQVALPRPAPSTIPYAFGQLPSTANPADPKSQHPIPGSFNRHAFNPKTQSFVPGGAGIPAPQTPHHGSPHHGSPHHGSPHLTYNSYTPPQQFGNGMGYNMARQGSNSSIPSYHASPHMAHRPMIVQGMPQPHGLPQGGMHVSHPINQQSMHGMQSNGPPGSHLPTYGNPSTLPPKPPTGV